MLRYLEANKQKDRQWDYVWGLAHNSKSHWFLGLNHWVSVFRVQEVPKFLLGCNSNQSTCSSDHDVSPIMNNLYIFQWDLAKQVQHVLDSISTSCTMCMGHASHIALLLCEWEHTVYMCVWMYLLYKWWRLRRMTITRLQEQIKQEIVKTTVFTDLALAHYVQEHCLPSRLYSRA